MKIYENPWKSMIINRKRWKSSDDKKPAWNRAKVSIGAAGWTLPSYTVVNIHARKSMKIHENLWKSMKINENQCTPNEKQYKSYSFAWISLNLSLVFPSFVCFSMLYGQPSGWPYTMEIHTKLGITEEKSSKIHAKLCNLYCFSLEFHRFSYIYIL